MNREDKKIFSRFAEIFAAWVAERNPSEEERERARGRLATCMECPLLKSVATIPVCSACGCPVNKKVYTPLGLKGCPNGYWTE